MKLNNLIAISCLVLSFSSCVVSNHNYPDKKITEGVNPPLNEVHTQNLGNSLITQYKSEQIEFVSVSNKPEIKYFQNKELKEDSFEFIRSVNKMKFYINKNDDGEIIFPGIAINKDGDAFGIIGENVINNRFILREFDGELNYTIKFKDIVSDQNFKQELLYNGKSDNSIKFTYREFVGSLIRPAFHQEVQYDLSQSDEIGFKNLRIKIVEATNTEIKYKILSSF